MAIALPQGEVVRTRSNAWICQPHDAVESLLRAQRNIDLARSWRNFRVSSCGVVLHNIETEPRYLYGVNRKPAKSGPIDIHAEAAVLEEAAQSTSLPLSVLALVADVQPDDTTNLLTPTLLPCSRACLPKLEASPHIDPKSLIVSAGPDMTTVQYYDIHTLREAYETNDPSLLSVVQFETAAGKDRQEWDEKLVSVLGSRIVGLV